MAQMGPEKFLLIDCDPGADDCLAIMMALSQYPHIETVGITCVMGNVGIDQVVMNAMRIVKLYDLIEKVPVFRGCSEPIIARPESLDSSFYHGEDGFGNVAHVEPKADEKLLDFVQKEHAVNAIIRLSKEYAGKLQIVAIGPLTNLAIATKIDPDVPKRLKSLHILGGTYKGHGNATPCAEYNFFADPEAANITLNNYSLHCDVQLVTYEVTNEHCLPVEWFEKHVTNQNNQKSFFFQQIFGDYFKSELKSIALKKINGIVVCDAYAMFVVLFPNSILKSKLVRMGVELGGFLARGSLIIDHRNNGSPYITKKPIELVEEVDLAAFMKVISDTMN